MNPIEGQYFKNAKGVFKVVGIWRNSDLSIKSFEIQDEHKKVTEVDAITFQTHEAKIEYFENERTETNES